MHTCVHEWGVAGEGWEGLVREGHSENMCLLQTQERRNGQGRGNWCALWAINQGLL